jgi:primary-amine oxidase
MSLQTSSYSSPAPRVQAAVHPFTPLSADEISIASGLIESQWPAQVDIHFKVLTLVEPPKVEVLPYLEAEKAGRPLPRIARKALVNYYIRNTVSSLAIEVRVWLQLTHQSEQIP